MIRQGPLTREDPSVWKNAILKSLRFSKGNAVAISGRLLSLVTNGIIAHADACRPGYPCVGAVFQLLRDIPQLTKGLYYVEPADRTRDPAHTNLVRVEVLDFRTDPEALQDEAHMLHTAFVYRHRDDMRGCEERAGWGAQP